MWAEDMVGGSRQGPQVPALFQSDHRVLVTQSQLPQRQFCHLQNKKPFAGLEEAQAGIKIAGRNIYNLRYADDTTLMAESEEELKSLLMKIKVESEKLA